MLRAKTADDLMMIVWWYDDLMMIWWSYQLRMFLCHGCWENPALINERSIMAPALQNHTESLVVFWDLWYFHLACLKSLNQIKRQLCFVFAIQTERWWKFLFVLLHFHSSFFFFQPRRFCKTTAFHWLSLVDTIHITGKILLKHRHRHVIVIWEGFKHITGFIHKYENTNTRVLSSSVRIQNSLWLLSCSSTMGGGVSTN